MIKLQSALCKPKYLYLLFVVLLVVGLSPCASAAEDIIIPETLSLSDAVALSLGANVTLKSASEAHRAALSQLRISSIDTTYSAGSDVSMAHSSDDSTVSSRVYGNITYQGLQGTRASLDMSPIGIGDTRGGIGISIRHPLLSGKGNLSAKADLVESARTNVAVRHLDFFQSQQSTVLRVVETYFGAVLAREQVKVQERALAIAEEVADGTKKREEAGLVTGIEVTRAEINVAQTRDSLNLQRQSARGAMDRLMLAMGVGVGQSPELTDAVPDGPVEVPEIERAIGAAYTNRPELAVYDERIISQNRKLSMVEDELRPSLDVVARLSTASERGGSSDSIFSQRSSTIGIDYRIPLDKRIIREEQETAVRTLDVMREQRVFKEDEIAEEVRRAYRDLESAKLSLEIFSQNLDVARERLRLAQRMVEEGEASNRDVLEAQESLTRVESSMLSARVGLFIAGLRLKYAMGEDLTEMGLR